MELNFHAVYTDGREKFNGLDHYDGATSLLGLAQILLISLNAFFNREIITQAPSAKGFRVVLGNSKSGSFDQLIRLIITNQDVLDVAKDIGKDGIYDLLKGALLSGVGVRHLMKNRKAKKVMRELERANDDLQEKLDDALRRAHYPVKHQGLTIHVMSGRTNLVTFNEGTLRYLETEIVHEDTEVIRAAVSRFNARTGTGRLINTVDAPSVPFYPDDTLSQTSSNALVDSLSELTRNRFSPIEAVVSRVTSADGTLKSYKLFSAWKP